MRPKNGYIDVINDHFRATGAYDAALVLSYLFNVSLQGDDIQHVDTRWDQALLSAGEIPKENILEGLYMLKKYEILFSFSQYGLCTTKKLIEF